MNAKSPVKGHRPAPPMLDHTELAATDVAGDRLARGRPASLILGVVP